MLVLGIKEEVDKFLKALEQLGSKDISVNVNGAALSFIDASKEDEDGSFEIEDKLSKGLTGAILLANVNKIFDDLCDDVSEMKDVFEEHEGLKLLAFGISQDESDINCNDDHLQDAL